MMYKCENCGHLFEEGEQTVWYENQGECHGITAMERFSGCPLCHDDYNEVYQCNKCGDWHYADELYSGWCEKCLRKTINYDTFLAYCEENKDEHYLDMFVLSELLGGMDLPEDITTEFHCLMVEYYRKEVNAALFVSSALNVESSFEFRDRCIRFIMDDDGSIGRENYAGWLNNREAK